MTIRYARALALALAIGLGGLAACGGTDPSNTTSTTSGSGGATTGWGGAGGGWGGAGGGGAGGCHGASSASSSGAGGAPSCDGPGARYVTHVVSACFGAGETYGHDHFPEIVYGPPKGGGCCNGSLDVASLGNGGTITLAFDNVIVDGPGVDFIVFENAFDVSDDPNDPYAEIATVEVSPDGVTWTAFPCTATAYPYGSCAGWHPVFGNPETGTDPLDPKVAGGDPYDLADIGVASARFVRITDRADMPGSFDLDAVGIVNAQCP